MNIAKFLFRRKTVLLLAAAILLAALPPLQVLRAGTPPESQGPEDEAAESAKALNASDKDAPQSAASLKDLEAQLAEAAAGSEETKLALEALDEVDVDAELSSLPEAAGEEARRKEPALENEGGQDPGQLEKEAESDEKEISAVEKDTGNAAEPGEDDKGDKIEREDPGMDD